MVHYPLLLAHWSAYWSAYWTGYWFLISSLSPLALLKNPQSSQLLNDKPLWESTNSPKYQTIFFTDNYVKIMLT